MAYELHAGASLAAEFERLAREEVASALDHLGRAESDFDEGVHDTRKRLKRLRAVLRLWRGSLPGAFRRLDRAISDVAHGLAPAREEAALAEACAKLAASVSGEADPSFPAALAALADATRAERRHDGRNAEPLLARAAGALTVFEQGLSGACHAEDGWPAIAFGFRQSYARAREAWRDARRAPDADRLHTWRKHVKYHFYHLTLLVPIWEGPVGARRREADTLGDLLGQHHDLHLLAQALPGLSAALTGFDPVALERSILREAARLEQQALALGARLCADRPRELTRRFSAYFDAARAPAEPPLAAD